MLLSIKGQRQIFDLLVKDQPDLYEKNTIEYFFGKGRITYNSSFLYFLYVRVKISSLYLLWGTSNKGPRLYILNISLISQREIKNSLTSQSDVWESLKCLGPLMLDKRAKTLTNLRFVTVAF